jgi:hypothetical protein
VPQAKATEDAGHDDAPKVKKKIRLVEEGNDD